jgi:nucleoside-diphosphate-sugar epimerase
MTARDGIEWLQGDAMNRDEVVAAANGASLIVHAVNPKGYRNWKGLALPMLDNSIAAAQASGARIVFPGTVYNYGPDAFPLLREDSPQHPRTRKGAIRVEMERRLRDAATVQSLVVRAGDFFGPRPGQSWFNQGLVKPGREISRILYPGAPGVGHAWAYLPDIAETIAQLVERPLERFATFHFAGHVDSDGTRMIESIRRVTGRPTLKLRTFPWSVLPLLAPFVTMLHEMREMRYLWRTELQLDNHKLVATLGREPHTDLDEAVRTTLRALGCLPSAASEKTA